MGLCRPTPPVPFASGLGPKACGGKAAAYPLCYRPVDFNACMLERAFPLAHAKANAPLNQQVALRVLVQISMLLKSDCCSQCTNPIRPWAILHKGQNGRPTRRGWAGVLAPGLDQGVIGLVEPRRIELLTSCVQGRRSPS